VKWLLRFGRQKELFGDVPSEPQTPPVLLLSTSHASKREHVWEGGGGVDGKEGGIDGKWEIGREGELDGGRKGGKWAQNKTDGQVPTQGHEPLSPESCEHGPRISPGWKRSIHLERQWRVTFLQSATQPIPFCVALRMRLRVCVCEWGWHSPSMRARRACTFICVSACVCDKERERKRETETKSECDACVCACVCV